MKEKEIRLKTEAEKLEYYQNLWEENITLKKKNKQLEDKLNKMKEYLEKNFYYCLASGDDITHYIDELIDYIKGIKEIEIIK